jgi:hypothetical protein
MLGLLDLSTFPRAYLCETARFSPDGYFYRNLKTHLEFC